VSLLSRFFHIPCVCVCGQYQPHPLPPSIADAFDLIVPLLEDGVGQ
jgi:hypothetical protein